MIDTVKNISLIALVVLVMSCIIGGIYYFRYSNKKIKELKENEKILNKEKLKLESEKKVLDKEYEELKNKPSKTVKEFVYLTDKEKIKEYENVLNQRNESFDLIEKYRSLCQSNAELASGYKEQYEEAIKLSNNVKWGVDFMGLVGISSQLKPEFIPAVALNKYFNLKFIRLGVGVGGYVNAIKDGNTFDGGGGVLQLKLTF